MKYRTLGNTDLRVSEIGLGCEGMNEDGYTMCAKLLDYAEQQGINFFDLYASDPKLRGAIGEALKGRREKFIIQGHICSIWENEQYLRTRDLEKTRAAFDDLLRLLQTDYIDVGMIHYCDALVDWEDIVNNGILDYALQLKKEGRIGHIGLSSHNPQVAQKAVETGLIEVLMFSVNPCYDLQPANEDLELLWAKEAYEKPLVNMDPDRERLYETCERLGVGITVMKAFGGGDLLDAELSPAGAALTVCQCIDYCLTRPGVAVVLCGAHSVEQLAACTAYETATDEERSYATALTAFPKISWRGHCMYCSHCAPCPMRIDVASVTKFLNLALAQGDIPETVREHYRILEAHASDCIGCGLCETRCPFGVSIRENMKKAARIFGE